MRRAAELQAGMLPLRRSKGDGFEVAAHLTAAREISGDFYDWYRAGNGRLAVTLADVMGKGLPASLMMATARAALRGVATVEPLRGHSSRRPPVMSAALEIQPRIHHVFHARSTRRRGVSST